MVAPIQLDDDDLNLAGRAVLIPEHDGGGIFIDRWPQQVNLINVKLTVFCRKLDHARL